MKRSLLMSIFAATVLITACESPTAAAPSLRVTVQYLAGGVDTFPAASVQGWWGSVLLVDSASQDTSYHEELLVTLANAPAGDSLHPPLPVFVVDLYGADLRGFPFNLTRTLGIVAGDTVSATLLCCSPLGRILAESGSVAITPLSADSLRAGFTLWTSLFRVRGTVDLPGQS